MQDGEVLKTAECESAGDSKHIFSDAGGMRGGSAAIQFGGNLAQPPQLSTKLFDHEFDHPYGFMKTMAYFLFNRASTSEKNMKPAEVKKITPILFAEELEPCIKFWTERMGFQKTVEVPEGNKIGFAIVEKNGVELMYQSFASAEKDNAATGEAVCKGPSFLYIEVADLDAALAAAKGAEIVMPVRTTFYHAREFGVKDPAGHYVIFAQQGAAAQ